MLKIVALCFLSCKWTIPLESVDSLSMLLCYCFLFRISPNHRIKYLVRWECRFVTFVYRPLAMSLFEIEPFIEWMSSIQVQTFVIQTLSAYTQQSGILSNQSVWIKKMRQSKEFAHVNVELVSQHWWHDQIKTINAAYLKKISLLFYHFSFSSVSYLHNTLPT